MGKSLFCRLCDNSVFRSLPGRSCADKCEEKTDCPKGNVTAKMTTIEKAVKKATTPQHVLYTVVPILEDKNTCYDDDDFVNFCIDLRLAAAYVLKKDKPIGEMRELVTKQTNEKYKELIHKVVTLTLEYTQEYGRELSGGKRRRRRKSRKSRRKSRKTKRKRRKSRKTKKRRKRRR